MEDSDVQQAEANQSSSTPTTATDQNDDSGQEKANEIPLKNPKLKITIKSPRIPPGNNVQNPTIVSANNELQLETTRQIQESIKKMSDTGQSDRERKTMEDSDVQQEEEKEKVKEEANQSSSTPTIATDQNNSGQEKANEIPLKNPKLKITIKSTRIPPGYNVQNPNIVSGPSDREGKLKTKAMNVSEEKNSSSSSPSSMAAAYTAASDKRALGISGEENTDSSSKKQKHDQSPGNDNPKTKSGDGNIFLFETEVTSSNRLVVPIKSAKQHFPPISAPEGSTKPQELHLTVPQIKEWKMPVIRYDDEKAFMFTRLWPQFVKFHDLKALDKIRFYTPVPRLHALHYVVAFARREGNLAQIPELRRGKFLFQLELSPSDVGYNRLFIQNEDVTLHFPWIYMAPQARKTDIIKFTDAQNKDWYMEIMRYDLQYYMIIEGWDEFVKERNLKASDVIKFYSLVQPSHGKHFLIECLKNEGETDLTQPDSTKNESDSKKW
ncbi:AP2/ERF and B3 domain-containing transcription repressor like [Actinidia chinensis var. chinensis]|uniref:AP2/ERF and B3 domain-containing transcription repressor like n=1 Tax=Actinidia chinensis var. chinensis TaxID=1590841 RepID=A0A2R6PP97_ACTCC|nr:AP2/ERF and B3 domain-containing transcription repressor like [Actinidia chinensis var. chinensis]